jgi:succinoglycan biosynthesis transport protein ExoP
VPPNPLELLTSHRFAEVVDKLKEAFDVVVIDSPPLQMVSDALVLSPFATSLIFVVKASSTPYQVAQASIKRLRLANAPVIGVVLNQLDLDKAERYYGEYGGYGYRGYRKKRYAYGYGQNEK